jgi:hypothetical protein
LAIYDLVEGNKAGQLLQKLPDIEFGVEFNEGIDDGITIVFACKLSLASPQPQNQELGYIVWLMKRHMRDVGRVYTSRQP